MRKLLILALPAAVAIIPGALLIGAGIALYLRLRERNRVVVMREMHSPRVTLISFVPAHRQWRERLIWAQA